MGLSLLLEAVASLSQRLERQRARPRSGPSTWALWALWALLVASLLRHGLGLPRPACLSPGSTWGLNWRLREGCQQTLLRLPVCLPSGSPLGATRVG